MSSVAGAEGLRCMTHDIGVRAAREDMALAKMAGCKHVTHDILSNSERGLWARSVCDPGVIAFSMGCDVLGEAC